MKAHKISNIKINLQKMHPGDVGFTAGVYILYRSNMGAPAYVGRADNRLYDHVSRYKHHPTYRYMKFMKCDSAEDAFQWHCIFWHKSQSTIDNSEANGGHHPRRPRNSNSPCPVPGCTHVFQDAVVHEDYHAPGLEEEPHDE